MQAVMAAFHTNIIIKNRLDTLNLQFDLLYNFLSYGENILEDAKNNQEWHVFSNYNWLYVLKSCFKSLKKLK